MKRFMMVLGLLTAFSSISQAESTALESLKALGLQEFYCDIKGSTQDENSINYQKTVGIFAKDQQEAIKLCLLKHEAGAGIDSDNVLRIYGRTDISKHAVIIEKISIRKGLLK